MYSSKKYSHHPNIKSLLNDLIDDENTLFDFISLNKGNVNWENESPKSPSKIIDKQILINKFKIFSQHLDKSGYAEDPMVDFLSFSYLTEKFTHIYIGGK